MNYLKYIVLLFVLNSCITDNKQKNLIVIEIEEPVSNFNISILWVPFKKTEGAQLTGPAIVRLQNIVTKRVSYVNFSRFSDDFVSREIKDIVVDKEGFVKSLTSQKIILKSPSILTPIQFSDVNFNGKEELILHEADFYNMDIRTPVFYSYKEDQFTKIESGFFASLPTDRATYFFDEETKEFHISEFSSCCEWDQSYYKLLDESYSDYDFRIYKSEHHFVDPKTNKDTITDIREYLK